MCDGMNLGGASCDSKIQKEEFSPEDKFVNENFSPIHNNKDFIVRDGRDLVRRVLRYCVAGTEREEILKEIVSLTDRAVDLVKE